MKKLKSGYAATALFVALMLSTQVNAQSAAPGSGVLLETITVSGGEGAEISSDDNPLEPVPLAQLYPEDIAREALEAMAGGTSIITEHDLRGRANSKIADALDMVPGVLVQSWFGGNDQSRIQIRGSGLQQTPAERGITILQDGLPLNRADGSYIIAFADPRLSSFTEVYRGNTANRLGPAYGGAINFTSPTGTTDPGFSFGVEGGSFGQVTTFAKGGARQGDLDAHIGVSYSQRDGFRENNESERVNINFNAGAKLNNNISTRLYAGYTDMLFEIPGPLTASEMSNPKQVHGATTFVPYSVPPVTGMPRMKPVDPGPNVPRDDPQRESTQYRVGSRTTAVFGSNLFDVALGYSYTEDSFRFPVSEGYRDVEGGDFTGVLRYAYRPDKSQPLPLFETTLSYSTGTADRDSYLNDGGTRGLQYGSVELESDTLSVYGGANVPFGNGFTLQPALTYAYAERDNSDKWVGPRPGIMFPPSGGQASFMALAQDISYSRTYDAWSPSLGLTYRNSGQTFFGSVSRSFEPPTHEDLIGTINGSPISSPGSPSSVVGTPPSNPANDVKTLRYAYRTPDLEAQTGTTIEAGWRGRTGSFSWDLVSYYSWIDDEILNLRDEGAARIGSVNADKTTRFGIELAVGAQLTDQLSSRLAYTYQDFRFDGDAKYGNNTLAGTVPHTVNASLRYAFLPNFFVETEVSWRPEGFYIDNGHALKSDGFATLGLRANYDINDKYSVYGEVRNVTDEVYASSGLVVGDANPGQTAFLPGDGRSFIIGLKGKF
jgi:iron complex outermembrane recepter protein